LTGRIRIPKDSKRPKSFHRRPWFENRIGWQRSIHQKQCSAERQNLAIHSLGKAVAASSGA
jgi:hypothetical protein